MKKSKTSERNLEQIRSSIRAEQGTIKNLEATIETATWERTSAQTIQDEVAYSALALNDPAARKN